MINQKNTAEYHTTSPIVRHYNRAVVAILTNIQKRCGT